MSSRFYLFIIFMLLFSISVFATEIQEGPGTTCGSTASNSYEYGYRVFVNNTCSLVTIQKWDTYMGNPGEGMGMTVYDANTSSILGHALWINSTHETNNATFSTPINLTAGHLYHIYENTSGTSRQICYESGASFPFPNNYTKFVTGCYDTNCGNTVGNANGAIKYLYLEPPAAPAASNPQWTYHNISTPTTKMLGAGSMTHKVNWTDDSGITNGYLSRNVTGSWLNTSMDNSSCIGSVTDCQWSVSNNYNASSFDAGTFGVKWYANDSEGNWNVTDTRYFTLYNVSPGWYDYGSNATGQSIEKGGATILYSNWTVSNGSLIYYQMRERLPNGSWYADNGTSWSNFSCGDYQDCAVEVLSNRSMEPVGNHTFVFAANSSIDGFNETPGFNITVTATYPKWTNTTLNSTYTFLGGGISFSANFTDNYNLTGTILSWGNSTHWNNGSFIEAWTYSEDYGYYGTVKSGKVVYTVLSGVNNHTGTWYHKCFVNNSVNNWNVSEVRQYEVYDQYPKWESPLVEVYNGSKYGNGSIFRWEDFTAPQFGPIVNWSTYLSFENMSVYAAQWWLPNGSVFNQSCPALDGCQFDIYSSCVIDYNTSCEVDSNPTLYFAYEKGEWCWKFFANNTLNEWNVTPKYCFNSSAKPDGGAALTNFSVTPCYTSTYDKVAWNNGTHTNFTIWVNDTQPYGRPWDGPSFEDNVSANVLFLNATDNSTYCESGWATNRLANHPIRLNISNCLNYTEEIYFVFQMNDTHNGTIINWSDTVNVTVTGYDAGACTTIYPYSFGTLPGEESEGTLKTAFEEARIASNMLPNMFWLFLMFLVVVSIWFPAGGYKNPPFAFVGTFMGLIIMNFLGWYWGFLNFGSFMVVWLMIIIIAFLAGKGLIKGGQR